MKQEELINLTKTLCKFFNLELEALQMKDRNTEIREPRQIIQAFLDKNRHQLSVSVVMIARVFEQDHATVLHSRKVVSNSIDTDRRYSEFFERFEQFGNKVIDDVFKSSQNARAYKDEQIKSILSNFYRNARDNDYLEALNVATEKLSVL